MFDIIVTYSSVEHSGLGKHNKNKLIKQTK